MKKSKLLLSSFCLAVALTLAWLPITNVHADDGGPQGGTNSTRPAPPPPPPPPSDLQKLLEWIISIFS